MSPIDVKRQLEDKMLISPIVMEAMGLIKNGMDENIAFAWAVLKLVDENEQLKGLSVTQTRLQRHMQESIDLHKENEAKLNEIIGLLRAQIMFKTS